MNRKFVDERFGGHKRIMKTRLFVRKIRNFFDPKVDTSGKKINLLIFEPEKLF